MADRKRRPLEWLKSLLIFLLTLSALYLAGRAFLNPGAGAAGLLGSLLPSPTLPTASQPGSMGQAEALRPVRMAVVNANGRYAVQYDDAAVDALFQDLGDLLGEALGSASSPTQITRQQWESALTREGVYYGLPGSVSLSLAASWMGENDPSLPLSARSQQLLLAKDRSEETVRLYYVDAEDGSYYACDTAVSFQKRLDDYAPNAAFFAFQQPGRYEALHPDTLILPQVPAPPIYQATAGVDFSDEATRMALMEALSFSPQPSAVYPSADGWSVRDGGDLLRLSGSGAVTFSAGDQLSRYPVLPQPDADSVAELTGELVARALSPTCGAARIYLSDLKQSGDTWTVTYSYLLSGAEVRLGQEGWCARFTLRSGTLVDYTLRPRHYELTEETAALLPEYQAMAAMESLDVGGRQLLLRYYDGGSGTVRPAWIAR